MRTGDHRPRTTDHGPEPGFACPLSVILLLALLAPLHGQPVPTDYAAFRRGEAVFKSLCYNCHGLDGRGAEKFDAPDQKMGPTLFDSPRITGHRDYVINVLLYGLTGPIDGTRYQEVMLPLGSNRDQWIADAANYVRGSFGTGLPPVAATDVARVRAAVGKRELWTLAELEPRIPKLISLDRARLSGGDPTGSPEKAITETGWQSSMPARKDSWLQLELPALTKISDLEFISSVADGFALQVSADGKNWSEAAIARRLLGWVHLRLSQPTPSRFARIVITAAAPNAPNWSVAGLRAYAVP